MTLNVGRPHTRHNLPTQRTRCVGPERELAEMKRPLTTTRLLTLVGAGTSGKTRLAVPAAEDLGVTRAESVWLVELAAINLALRPRVAPIEKNSDAYRNTDSSIRTCASRRLLRQSTFIGDGSPAR